MPWSAGFRAYVKNHAHAHALPYGFEDENENENEDEDENENEDKRHFDLRGELCQSLWKTCAYWWRKMTRRLPRLS